MNKGVIVFTQNGLQARAALEQHVGGALAEEQHGAVLVPVRRRHHLAFGAERHLPDPAEVRCALGGALELSRGDEERSLGGIALDLPLAIVLGQLSVVGERPGAEYELRLAVQVAVAHLLPVTGRAADGCIAHATQVDGARRGDDAFGAHLIGRERAGLVGADDGCRAQRLDARQVLDHGVALRHALHAEREHHREHRRQPFGHRRDGERDPEQQHLHEVGGRADALDERDGDHHHDRDDDDDSPEQAPEVVHLDLQRGRLLDRLVEHGRDRAHLGRHAGRRDDRPPGAPVHRGALVDHVAAIAERDRPRALDGLRMLLHGRTLTRERCLRDAQRVRAEQTTVGADLVALGEHEDVARHEFGARHGDQFAVAEHGRVGAGHDRQRRDRVLCASLLDEAERGVQQDYGEDHDRVDRQPLGTLDDPRDDRDDDRGQQQHDERVGERGEDAAPQWIAPGAAQLVRAHRGEAPSGVAARQTPIGIDTEHSGDGYGIRAHRVGKAGQVDCRVREVRHASSSNGRSRAARSEYPGGVCGSER